MRQIEADPNEMLCLEVGLEFGQVKISGATTNPVTFSLSDTFSFSPVGAC